MGKAAKRLRRKPPRKPKLQELVREAPASPSTNEILVAALGIVIGAVMTLIAGSLLVNG